MIGQGGWTKIPGGDADDGAPPGLSWSWEMDLDALIAAVSNPPPWKRSANKAQRRDASSSRAGDASSGRAESPSASDEATTAGESPDDSVPSADSPGRGREIPLAVAAGRVAESLATGPDLAGWLALSSAGRLEDGALAGIAASFHRLASWAQAGELAAVAEMASRSAAADDKIGVDDQGRPASLPVEACSQVALALSMSQFGANWWTDLGVTLAWRLRATGEALRSGDIDLTRARLIAEATALLDDDMARTVEARVLPAASYQTTGELRVALRRAVIAADPAGADRRREEAERKAKVCLYPDEEGTASLAGYSLPGVRAAAAMARVTALAKAMKAAGVPGGLNRLRAQVFLGLLLGTMDETPGSDEPGAPAAGPPGADSPAGDGAVPDASAATEAGSARPGGGPARPGGGPARPGGGPARPGGGPVRVPDLGADLAGTAPVPAAAAATATTPADSRPDDSRGNPDGAVGPYDGAAAPNDDRGNPDGDSGGPDDDAGGPDDDAGGPGNPDAPRDPRGRGNPGGASADHPDDHSESLGNAESRASAGAAGTPDDGYGSDDDDDDELFPARGPDWPDIPAFLNLVPGELGDPPSSGLLDLTVPWSALAGQSGQPGQLSRLGPITPAQARELAVVAAGNRNVQWRVIVTDPQGHALAVARVRGPFLKTGPPGRGTGPPTGGAGPPGPVGRATVTISAVTLARLSAAAPRAAGTWPGGAPLVDAGPTSPAAKLVAIRVLHAAARAAAKASEQAAMDAISKGGCAHAMATPAYRPPPRLREYVTARDVTCRFPPCRQPAWRADLDHTIPWEAGGPTCRCNLGGGCRTHHQLKQHPRWQLTQPEPGVFQWTTPVGRVYTSRPDRYPL